MSLRSDTEELARHLRDLSVEAPAIVANHGSLAIRGSIDHMAERARAIAAMIPTPEAHEREIQERVRSALADTDEIQERVRSAAGDAHTMLGDPPGTKIGRRDMHGKKLHIGDYVQVYRSERYGDPCGIVLDIGDNYGDGKERVRVALEGGVNDNYHPSVGRVERLSKVGKTKRKWKGANGKGSAAVTPLPGDTISAVWRDIAERLGIRAENVDPSGEAVGALRDTLALTGTDVAPGAARAALTAALLVEVRRIES